MKKLLLPAIFLGLVAYAQEDKTKEQETPKKEKRCKQADKKNRAGEGRMWDYTFKV